ncbi:MAG TPA: transcription-repair coupling factor, partial [Rhodobacteraceae bacterium]|nr:transcription-repair coupling factor [Paracoccaceae bacterium]
MSELEALAHGAGEIILSGVPEGFDALVLGDLARHRFHAGEQAVATHVLHVSRDDQRLAALASALDFFAPDVEVVKLPAWDCLPYDRISPNPVIASARLEALRALEAGAGGQPRITLTTVSAVLQRVPARESLREAQWRLRPGQAVDNERLMSFLAGNGYERTDLVREAGEYAVRGGIIDIFPSGAAQPVRLD